MKFPNIFPVTSHTRYVGPGSTFVAVYGSVQNGINFISQALAKGATTIVVQQNAELSDALQQEIKQACVQLVRVDDARQAVAQLSAKALGYPAKKLKIIGITGTKGKTTSAYVLEHILSTVGYKTALVSTVDNKICDQTIAGGLTTPLPDYLHVFFQQAVDAGVEYVVMEVSAQALTLHRVEGLEFDGVIFTNFDQEHAEFYATMDDYFQAKCLIFDQIKDGAPVLINADDQSGQAILAQHSSFMRFGLTQAGGATVDNVHTTLDGLSFDLNTHESIKKFSCPTLVGEFNLYNLLGCIALARQLGFSYDDAVHALQTMPHIPGRLERYALSNGAYCFIDYAHTPGSYTAVLSLLRKFTKDLVVVFGAGGERDHTKRPQMGRIASEIADKVILTSDNPRSENPQDIIDDILAGVKKEDRHKVTVQLDRARAIQTACAISQSSSIIALLGKGPDEYQLIGSEKISFSEKRLVVDINRKGVL